MTKQLLQKLYIMALYSAQHPGVYYNQFPVLDEPGKSTCHWSIPFHYLERNVQVLYIIVGLVGVLQQLLLGCCCPDSFCAQV